MSCHLKLQTLPENGGCACQPPSNSPPTKMRNSADSWQPEGASLESCCSTSSAHGTARTQAQRLGLLRCLASLNFKCIFGGPCQDASGNPSPKMRTPAHSLQPEGASLESCCSTSSALGTTCTEAQRLGLLACLATSNFKHSLGMGGGPCQAPFGSPALKKRTSADSWQPEGFSLESCSNSLNCPWHCSHRGTETEAASLSCQLKLHTLTWGSPPCSVRQPCSEIANVCR